MIRRIDSSVDGRRFYEGLNEKGERLWCYASNTTKIDETYPKDAFLIQWIREQGLGGQAIFEKAGDHGTEAHTGIDELIKGGKVSTELMPLKVKRSIQSFIDWVKDMKPEFIESEEMIVNHDLKFAGTRDLLCKIGNDIWVVDYKTGSTVQEKHKIQNAGYWSCTDPSYKTAILHLGNRTKKGYSWMPYEPEPYFEQFIHFNKTFDLLYPGCEPKIEEYPELFELPKKS